MPPKKHSSAIRVDTGVNNNNNNRGNDEEVKSYGQRYPNIRRFLALVIFIIVVGVPCPPGFFYSVFIDHSSLLYTLHRFGVFSDAIFMCEQSVNAVGPKYTHDHEYYRRLQNTLNLTNEDMYNYLQQWMCVMPPENYGKYIHFKLYFCMTHLLSNFLHR